jgi:prolyl-tRNA synthetase
LPVPSENTGYERDLAPVIGEWTKFYASTGDVHDQARFERETPAEKRIQTRGIEVGQVFYFGEKYSKPMRALITHPDGTEKPCQGGSYGVGVSRLAGAIIEASHDENGIIWPESVAPFMAGIANLKPGDGATDKVCDEIYAALQRSGIEVLYDDTDERPGAKFARLDLIGLPYQIIIGPKGLAEETVELKIRATGARKNLSVAAAIAHFAGR